MLERARRAGGLIEPCLPPPAPLSGPDWLHDTTASASWRCATPRACGSTPVAATISLRDFRSSWRPLRRCKVRSCLIDGEAVVSDTRTAGILIGNSLVL
jgi:hypothetical protein